MKDASRQCFAQKSRRTQENIPPTQASLKQPIKRTCYQTNRWNQALVLDQEMPEQSDWGWANETIGWQPILAILPKTSKSRHE